MRILLTNDDGIQAEGLIKLSHQLKKIAKVDIVAPDSERSSVGHGITLSKPIFYKKVFVDKKFFGHAITGTPADCIKLALNVILKNKPDLIVSGINLGPNDGCSVFYSGTVAGAREGSLAGIPAVALSLGTFKKPNFSLAAEIALKLMQQISFEEIPRGSFLNINIPHCSKSKIKGVKITKQGLTPIHSEFVTKKDPSMNTYFWMTGESPKIKKDLDCDTAALAKNFITITPIHLDVTDYKYFNKVKMPNFDIYSK